MKLYFVVLATHVIFENYSNQHIKKAQSVGLNESCRNVRDLPVTD